MKCAKCGVDIYEGVKKCPYCKTLTGAGEDEGKFKDFDFKYTISLSDQKKIEDTAREGGSAPKQNAKKAKPLFSLPNIRRKTTDEKAETVESPAETPAVDADARAREIAKSASQRAAEFIPEGMARYTVRGMDGAEVQPAETEETLAAYTRVKATPEPIKEPRHYKRRTRRSRSIDKKAIIALGAAVLCIFAIILGISAISSAVSQNSSVAIPYTYVKDNTMYMVYKNKTVKLSETVITDSYLRAVEENDVAVSAERAAKDAQIVKTAKNGKRTYFFENFDPETGSGVLKYIDKGKVKKIKEIYSECDRNV